MVLTIEQMQELEELGIETSKASMCWGGKIHMENGNTTFIPEYTLSTNSFLCSILDADEYKKYCIPTFTLQDILEMLPKTIIVFKDGTKLPLVITITGSGKYAIAYDNPFIKNGKLGLTTSESLLEAAFKMLKWCKRYNYI